MYAYDGRNVGAVYGETVNQSVQEQLQEMEGRLFKNRGRDPDPVIQQGKLFEWLGNSIMLSHQFPRPSNCGAHRRLCNVSFGPVWPQVLKAIPEKSDDNDSGKPLRW